MKCPRILPLLALVALCGRAADIEAQQPRPTPEQARVLLQTRPDLVAQLRDRLTASGMSPDEIRARLRAEGYPENLLDAYLPGSDMAAPDSLSEDVLSAMEALSLTETDSTSAMEEVLELRESITRSGMSPAEIRSRLRSAEYPQNLLDPYLPGTLAALPDSVTQDVRTAAVAIGLVDAADSRDARAELAGEARALKPWDEPDSKPGDETVIYGLEVFRRRSSQFDPNLAGPVDDNYRVGAGDRLMLLLSGQVESAIRLDVTREGFVVIPQVGRVDVANLTLRQVEDVFFDRLRRVYSEMSRSPGARTRFSVSPVSLRSNQVYVIGDVNSPGSYRVSGAGTALTALYAAGGPTATGTMRSIEIRRGSRVVGKLDVYEYLLRGYAANDVRLENGDVVFVGVHGPRVQLAGEVIRPATYEMKPGETLAELISAAGGYRPTANRQRMQIERLAPARSVADVGRERFVIDVPMADSENGHVAPPFELANGDIVRVFPITRRVRSSVRVAGNVWLPGRVGYTPGMTLSQAVQSAGGVKPDVYLHQVVISRLLSDSSRTSLYSAFADTTGRVLTDVPLQEDDIITVFGVTEFRQERYVNIAGAVRRPGQYPYREDMTMRDLILQAGGLHERALLTEAEIARMPDNRSGGQLAVTRRVPLDSTYIFERGADGRYLGPPGVPAPDARAPEVELQAYDNVLILEQPNWEMPRLVTIHGEVRLPGTYTLLNKEDRLSEIIARAGGLTQHSYPAGVIFTRSRDNIGRIGIDLPRVMREPRFRDNLQLEDGDNIFVPTFRNTVVVGGAVNSPVAVSYVPGRDIDWYIDAAGGPSVKAQAARSWVVQPNGTIESKRRRFMFPDGSPEPQPGSVVHVPERDASETRTDRIQLIGAVTQILSGLVAVLAIVVR